MGREEGRGRREDGEQWCQRSFEEKPMKFGEKGDGPLTLLLLVTSPLLQIQVRKAAVAYQVWTPYTHTWVSRIL